jgi:hypothetical protein
LIAGLAKVSEVKAPMVVDTPLGKLDSKHRANILSFWTEDKSSQVILLSQDEELISISIKIFLKVLVKLISLSILMLAMVSAGQRPKRVSISLGGADERFVYSTNNEFALPHKHGSRPHYYCTDV